MLPHVRGQRRARWPGAPAAAQQRIANPLAEEHAKLLKRWCEEAGLSVGVEKLRERQRAAANRGKALDAAAYALRAELASPQAERAYFKTRLTDG